MTMDIDVSENQQQTHSKPAQLGIGQHLKSAREAQHLSTKEAAARLHLSVSVILMMENEDFQNAPPLIFLRGYLRAYARLLNIPDPDIQIMLAQFAVSQPSPISQTPLTIPLNANAHGPYARWTTYVIILVLVVLVGMWWNSHSRYTIADIPAKTDNVPTVSTTRTAAPTVATPNTTHPPAAATGARTNNITQSPAPVAPTAGPMNHSDSTAEPRQSDATAPNSPFAPQQPPDATHAPVNANNNNPSVTSNANPEQQVPSSEAAAVNDSEAEQPAPPPKKRARRATQDPYGNGNYPQQQYYENYNNNNPYNNDY